MAGYRNRLPQFMAEREVPADITPPAKIVGLYSVREAYSDSPRYDRLSVLTSQGWVPPVAHSDLMLLRADSDGELHDLDTFEAIPTSQTRTTIDPRELRAEIDPDRIENRS